MAQSITLDQVLSSYYEQKCYISYPNNIQWQMQDFLKGGSVIMPREILRPCPLSSKPRQFSNIFERSFLPYLSIHSFLIEMFANTG